MNCVSPLPGTRIFQNFSKKYSSSDWHFRHSNSSFSFEILLRSATSGTSPFHHVETVYCPPQRRHTRSPPAAIYERYNEPWDRVQQHNQPSPPATSTDYKLSKQTNQFKDDKNKPPRLLGQIMPDGCCTDENKGWELCV